jgi:hypothetical protein
MADLNAMLAVGSPPSALNPLMDDITLAGRSIRRPREPEMGALPPPSAGERFASWLGSLGMPRWQADRVGAVVPFTPPGAAFDAGSMIGEGIEAGSPPTVGLGAGFAALAALPLSVGARVPRVRGGRGSGTLPMDPESVATRQRQLGFSEQPFWRGDAGTASEYPGGGFFARDVDTATGHARRHQQSETAQAREFRLALEPRFLIGRPLTVEEGARISAIVAPDNPRLAADIRGVVEEGLPAAHILQALGGVHGGARDILRRAGFRSIDTGGGDALMLSGSGIRSAGAAFDPTRAHLPNIHYGLPFALAPFAWQSNEHR